MYQSANIRKRYLTDQYYYNSAQTYALDEQSNQQQLSIFDVRNLTLSHLNLHTPEDTAQKDFLSKPLCVHKECWTDNFNRYLKALTNIFLQNDGMPLLPSEGWDTNFGFCEVTGEVHKLPQFGLSNSVKSLCDLYNMYASNDDGANFIFNGRAHSVVKCPWNSKCDNCDLRCTVIKTFICFILCIHVGFTSANVMQAFDIICGDSHSSATCLYYGLDLFNSSQWAVLDVFPLDKRK